MRPDALVFDLDGTLWDTTATCADAWNRVVARLGIVHPPVTREDVRAVTGTPHRTGIRKVFPTLPDETIDLLAEATAEEDNRAIAEHGGTLYPGVRETVPVLRAAVPLLIVSNCQRGYVETFLAWSGLGGAFVDHECWGNTGQSKTANLAAIVRRNGLRAPLFVGDTDGDRQAADDNGIPFVYVGWGFGAAARRDHRVERFADLVALLR